MSEQNNNNNNNNEENNTKANITQTNERPPLPRHDVTSRISEIFELIDTDKKKNN